MYRGSYFKYLYWLSSWLNLLCFQIPLYSAIPSVVFLTTLSLSLFQHSQSISFCLFFCLSCFRNVCYNHFQWARGYSVNQFWNAYMYTYHNHVAFPLSSSKCNFLLGWGSTFFIIVVQNVFSSWGVGVYISSCRWAKGVFSAFSAFYKATRQYISTYTLCHWLI